MKKVANRWIFLVILIFLIQISANSPGYKLLYEDNHFLTENILQVLPLNFDNQNGEVILAGKNNINREFFLYWLTFDSQDKPIVQWQSENLYEDHSIIWAVTGKFTSDKNQLLVLSNSQYYLYQFENNHVNLIKKAKHNFHSLNIPTKDFNGKIVNVTSGDVDGDGQAEIIVARVGKITAKMYNGLIQVWKFVNGELQLVNESDLIGNIRGLTAGDMEQSGKAEIFVEEGPKFAPGNIHVLHQDGDKLTEIYCLKKATKGPAYGMQVKLFPDGYRLVVAAATAEDTGFIDFFRYQDSLIPVDKEINIECDIMSMAVINLNNDQDPLLLIAGYPQDLLLYARDKTEAAGEK